MILALWTYSMTQWTERNIGVHGHRSALEVEETKELIERACDRFWEKVETNDPWLLWKPLEMQLSNNYDTLIAWLSMIKNIYANECETERIF